MSEKLDRSDIRLLDVLQGNARLSNQELSEKVNLSASSCHRRVREMEKRGVIEDYVVKLDARKLGLKAVVFVEITLSNQSRETFEAFEAAVVNLPNLLECHLMAGSADYQIKIVVQDAEHFAKLHRQFLSRLPHVANMQSSFALKTVFRTTAMPLNYDKS